MANTIFERDDSMSIVLLPKSSDLDEYNTYVLCQKNSNNVNSSSLPVIENEWKNVFL